MQSARSPTCTVDADGGVLLVARSLLRGGRSVLSVLAHGVGGNSRQRVFGVRGARKGTKRAACSRKYTHLKKMQWWDSECPHAHPKGMRAYVPRIAQHKERVRHHACTLSTLPCAEHAGNPPDEPESPRAPMCARTLAMGGEAHPSPPSRAPEHRLAQSRPDWASCDHSNPHRHGRARPCARTYKQIGPKGGRAPNRALARRSHPAHVAVWVGSSS